MPYPPDPAHCAHGQQGQENRQHTSQQVTQSLKQIMIQTQILAMIIITTLIQGMSSKSPDWPSMTVTLTQITGPFLPWLRCPHLRVELEMAWDTQCASKTLTDRPRWPIW